MQIIVSMNDGSVQTFPKVPPYNARFDKTVSYEGAFVIIKDEWAREFAIPANLVSSIVTIPDGVPRPDGTNAPDAVLTAAPIAGSGSPLNIVGLPIL